MVFVKIVKSRRSVSELGHDEFVTMGAYLADNKTYKGRSVTMRVSHALLMRLNWDRDEENRVSVIVAEGTGLDCGFLMLMEDPKGYSRILNKDALQGATFAVSVDRLRHYGLNECPVPMHEVTHIVDGKNLIIECPDWLRYNPLSDPDYVPEPQPEPEPAKVHTLHQPKQNKKRQAR